jgi:hypothetical protein
MIYLISMVNNRQRSKPSYYLGCPENQMSVIKLKRSLKTVLQEVNLSQVMREQQYSATISEYLNVINLHWQT